MTNTYHTTMYLGLGEDISEELQADVFYDVIPETTEGDGRPVPAEVSINSIVVEQHGKRFDISFTFSEDTLNKLSQEINNHLLLVSEDNKQQNDVEEYGASLVI
jgi:hypothetical protein